MHTIQDIFDTELKKYFTFPKFVASLLRDKFKVEGIELTDRQTDQVAEIFSGLENEGRLGDNLNLRIDDDGKISFSQDAVDNDKVVELASLADEKIKKILDSFPEIVIDFVENVTNDSLDTLKAEAGQMIKEHASIQRGFEKRLYRKWQQPLQLMEMFIFIAEEAGSDYNDHIRSTSDISKAYKFEALRRLHARACQVAKEVLTLLKSGFSDGAHARWRTLHEICVVANFLGSHDDELAERYLLHDVIERYRSIDLYQEYSQQLGLQPFTNIEIETLREQSEWLIARFGPEYKNENGWAALALRKKDPSFADIESTVDLRHIRPFYKLACINVHASARGILFRLGLSEDQQNQILLSGSSDMGLTDPGENTAYSLMLATSSLLTYDPNLDSLVALNILMKLEQEIFDAFDQAENRYFHNEKKMGN
jgi:hypothetical protein